MDRPYRVPESGNLPVSDAYAGFQKHKREIARLGYYYEHFLWVARASDSVSALNNLKRSVSNAMRQLEDQFDARQRSVNRKLNISLDGLEEACAWVSALTVDDVLDITEEDEEIVYTDSDEEEEPSLKELDSRHPLLRYGVVASAGAFIHWVISHFILK